MIHMPLFNLLSLMGVTFSIFLEEQILVPQESNATINFDKNETPLFIYPVQDKFTNYLAAASSDEHVRLLEIALCCVDFKKSLNIFSKHVAYRLLGRGINRDCHAEQTCKVLAMNSFFASFIFSYYLLLAASRLLIRTSNFTGLLVTRAKSSASLRLGPHDTDLHKIYRRSKGESVLFVEHNVCGKL